MSKYCPIKDGPALYLDCNECQKQICHGYFFCLIVGTRTFSNYESFKKKCDYLLQNVKDIVIVSGGAKGTDTLAKQYAKEKDYYYIEFPANWNKHGKAAGYIRNDEMHKFISKQKNRGVIAFWNGKSKGTEHSFGLAKKYDNPLKLIKI